MNKMEEEDECLPSMDSIIRDHEYIGEISNSYEIEVTPTTTNPTNQSKYTWCVEATDLLLDLIGNYMEDLRCPFRRKVVYENLCAELSAQGYHFTPYAVKNKWKSLIRVYKGNKDKLIKCGKPANRFSFYAKMDELWGHKHLVPVSNTHIVNFLEMDELQTDNEELTQEHESAFKRKKRIAQKEADKARRHSERIAMEKAKLDVHNKMLALEKERTNLIRRLIEKK